MGRTILAPVDQAGQENNDFEGEGIEEEGREVREERGEGEGEEVGKSEESEESEDESVEDEGGGREERGGFTVSGRRSSTWRTIAMWMVKRMVVVLAEERPRVRVDSDGNQVYENGDYIDEELRTRSICWDGWYI
ncbi:hypothetical protein TWF788_003490 [Orbilia oligospora]|uniref:Uncharacterized protein n=1 Tax=Orbilia oligospora TaxID=2813651 RepID=A0A7C8K306_ORBOL|nr:hypothetical protein TWF788_003490 [Orbilia oligospora]